MTLPTTPELEVASRRFEDHWGLVDKALYRLCRENPDHVSQSAVTAKVALIGRVYAAGMERLVTPPQGQQAVVVIADFMHSRGREIDEIIGSLDGIEEPLSSDSMREIVQAHGRLTDLLSACTSHGQAPRSFASKYLHFHRPVVPIFDDYARIKLSRIVGSGARRAPFAAPPLADPEYYGFCSRFFLLYDAYREAGVEATVKNLDAYLWEVPV